MQKQKENRLQSNGSVPHLCTGCDWPKDLVNRKQLLSEKVKGFLELHNHIMNIKGWLRGIHHKCQGASKLLR